MSTPTFQFGRKRIDVKFEKRYFPFIERFGKIRFGWRGKIYFRTATQAEGYARRWAMRSDQILAINPEPAKQILIVEAEHADQN